MNISRKNLIELGNKLKAIDITYKSFKEIQELTKKEKDFNSNFDYKNDDLFYNDYVSNYNELEEN